MSQEGMTINELARKVDDQARFTRSVTIICSLLVVGVQFYTLTEMFSTLPSVIVLQFLGNLEKFVREGRMIESNIQMKKSNEVTPVVKPAAEPAK